MTLLNKLGIGAAVAVALFLAGTLAGYQYCSDRHEEALRDAVERATEQAQAIASQDADILRESVTEKVKVREVVKVLYREAKDHADVTDNPLCFDDERLRIFNAAASLPGH